MCVRTRQATCRDLECCPHHCCWDSRLDGHSKAFKAKKLARDAARVRERGPKNHLPRAGRYVHMYVQRSAADEGRGNAGNRWLAHRGVYKWFKRMGRASHRLPAYKEHYRAYAHAFRASQRARWPDRYLAGTLWEGNSEASDPATDSDDYDY